jgi:hypothetical protein
LPRRRRPGFDRCVGLKRSLHGLSKTIVWIQGPLKWSKLHIRWPLPSQAHHTARIGVLTIKDANVTLWSPGARMKPATTSAWESPPGKNPTHSCKQTNRGLKRLNCGQKQPICALKTPILRVFIGIKQDLSPKMSCYNPTFTRRKLPAQNLSAYKRTFSAAL